MLLIGLLNYAASYSQRGGDVVLACGVFSL